jgi:hypothetical protein
MYFFKKKIIYIFVHIGSWKLHAAFLFKIAIIDFFVKPSFWKSKNTNRLHFWRGLRIFISFWFNQKKRSRYDQKKANSYKALKFEHAHLHVFHWTVGFFLHQYQPLKIKSIVFVRFKFWKQIWNQNKIMNRTVSFKF